MFVATQILLVAAFKREILLREVEIYVCYLKMPLHESTAILGIRCYRLFSDCAKHATANTKTIRELYVAISSHGLPGNGIYYSSK